MAISPVHSGDLITANTMNQVIGSVTMPTTATNVNNPQWNTNYTNNTGYPIVVYATIDNSTVDQNTWLSAVINNGYSLVQSALSGGYACFCFIVPPTCTYKFTWTGAQSTPTLDWVFYFPLGQNVS